MHRLIVRDQGHQVDTIQALHALESFEAAPLAEVVVGDDHDLAHEMATAEALPNALQQLILVCGIQRHAAAARRQKGKTYPQRQTQLRDSILRRQRADARLWIQKI